jgi:hypothetical protein
MHIGRDRWESELPLDRSEHFRKKQHGGYENSFYTQAKEPNIYTKALRGRMLSQDTSGQSGNATS